MTESKPRKKQPYRRMPTPKNPDAEHWFFNRALAAAKEEARKNPQPLKKHRPGISKSRKALVLKLRRQGLSFEEIARQAGVSVASAHKICKEAERERLQAMTGGGEETSTSATLSVGSGDAPDMERDFCLRKVQKLRDPFLKL